MTIASNRINKNRMSSGFMRLLTITLITETENNRKIVYFIYRLFFFYVCIYIKICLYLIPCLNVCICTAKLDPFALSIQNKPFKALNVVL